MDEPDDGGRDSLRNVGLQRHSDTADRPVRFIEVVPRYRNECIELASSYPVDYRPRSGICPLC
jgi:hypothetical protein